MHVSKFKQFLHTYRKVAWVIAGSLLIVLPLVFVLRKAPKAQAAWFDDSWAYRESFTFTNSGAISSPRRVTITLNTSTLGTKINSNCTDARFTDASGKLLPYQLTSACQLTSTTFDVVFNSIVDGTNLGYFYYGNPNATSATTDVSAYTSLGTPTVTTGTESQGPGPLAYWRFDEGNGTTTSDATGKGNTATFAGSPAPTWQTEDLCVSGKCLYFNGTTANNTVATTISNVQTVSVWVRPNVISSTAPLVDLDGGTHKVMISAGSVVAPGFASPSIYVNGRSIATVTANQWNFVEVTTATPFNTTSSLTMGKTGSTYLKGFMDDMKIFNYARSAAQVNADFSAAGSTKGSSSSIGGNAQSNNTSLTNGLVGYWRFDENTGTAIKDSSGNGNAGALTHSGWGPGKYGTGMTTANDANTDVTTVTNPASGILDFSNTQNYTTSAWVKFGTQSDSSQKFYVAKNFDGNPANPGYAMTMTHATGSGGILCAYSDGVGGAGENVEYFTNAVTEIEDGNWHFVVCVMDRTGKSLGSPGLYIFYEGVNEGSIVPTEGSGVTSGNLTIGEGAGGQITGGGFDEVRIYNRALTQSEITNLYTFGPAPVGYWRLDDATGTTAADSSGSSLNGTASSTPPTWVRNGKIGGVAQFVSSGTAANNELFDMGLNPATFQVGSAASFTIAAWFYPTKDPTDGTDGGVIFGFRGAGANNAGYELHYTCSCDTPSNGMELHVNDQGTGSHELFLDSITTGISLNHWHHVEAVFDRNTLANSKIYLDGVDEKATIPSGWTSLASISPQTGDNVHATIGGHNVNGTLSNGFDGYIDEVKYYNYARNAKQVVQDMNGGHPSGGSPIASQIIYWKLDEDNGNTINNTNTQWSSLSGTNSGAVWLLDNKCKVNGCLNFDTSTDNVTAGDTAFTDSLTGMTVSFWINPQTLAVDHSIISKNDASQRSFAIVTDHTTSSELRVHIAASTGEAANTTYITTSGLGLTTGSWQHIMVVYDGTNATAANRVTVYKNGKPITTSMTGTIPASMTSGSTSNLKLGDDDSATYSSLLTYLDEVKIYNSALSQSEVLVDYNNGSAIAMGGVLANTNNSNSNTTNNEGFGGAAPIGWWKMDDNTGTSTIDSSGNGKTMSFFGSLGSSSWTQGKYGSGLKFVASTNDYARNSSTFIGNDTAFTVSLWFKSTDTTKEVMFREEDTGPGFINLDINDNATGDVDFAVLDNSSVLGEVNAGNIGVNDGKWHFLEGVQTSKSSRTFYVDGVNRGTNTTTLGTVTTGKLYFGQNSGTAFFFNGTIDDVKIYDYARSAAQAAYDYNRGAPVAWYKFDECQGTIAHNSVLNANGDPFGINGTITMGSGTITTLGTCSSGSASESWNVGTNGKFNASLAFDSSGQGDFVDIPRDPILEPINGITVSVWVKVTGTHNVMMVLAKDYDSGNNPSYYLYYWNTAGGFLFCLKDQTCTPAATGMDDGNWHHLVGVSDMNTFTTLYADGKQVGAPVAAGAPDYTTNDLFIGDREVNYGNQFWGQIDDVRIYNYALTATQIKNLYNGGSSIYYGPASGTP